MNLTEKRRLPRHGVHQTTGLDINPWTEVELGSADRISRRALVYCGGLLDVELKGWENSTGNIGERILPFVRGVTGQWYCGCDVIGLYSEGAPLGGPYEGLEFVASSFSDDFRSDFRKLLGKISTFVNLPKGWDGIGSLPTTALAAGIAIQLLSGAHGTAALLGLNESAGPLPNGGLDLEWNSPDGHELLIEVQPQKGNLSYVLGRKAADGSYHDKSGRLANLNDARELVGKLA